MSALAYLDGRLVELDETRIDPGDAGLRLGDGLFETLLVYERRLVDLDAHLDRLFAGLERVEIEIDERRSDLAAAAVAVGRAAPRPRARMRITVTRGVPGAAATRLITADPWAGPGTAAAEGAALVVADGRLCSDHPLRGLKSISYQAHALALRRARARGAWDAIWLNEDGRVVEGTRSTLLARFEDEVVTPPESDGCLPGTVRRRLLEAAIVRERSLSLSRLLSADEILVANSLVGVLPVRALAGHRFEPGPAADALRRHWKERWLCAG